eukprot:gene18177-24612_t
MDILCTHLAAAPGIVMHSGTKVQHASFDGSKWALMGSGGVSSPEGPSSLGSPGYVIQGVCCLGASSGAADLDTFSSPGYGEVQGVRSLATSSGAADLDDFSSPGYVEVQGVHSLGASSGAADLDAYRAHVSQTKSVPLFSLMMLYDPPLALPFDGAVITDSPQLSWVGVDSAKPVS